MAGDNQKYDHDKQRRIIWTIQKRRLKINLV